MDMHFTKMRLSDRLIEAYYYIITTIYFASMFVGSIRPGVLSSLVMMIIIAIRISENPRINIKVHIRVALVAFYAIWCGASIIWFDSRVGINAYVEAVSNSLMPMIFAFFMISEYDKVWKAFLYNYMVVGFLGTFLLIAQPSWFVSFCLSRGFDYRRLSFAFGSIIMGTMGAVAVIASLYQIIASKGKKGKVQYIFACLFAFLSMQRSAWVVVVLTLFLAHYYMFFKYRVVKKRFILVELVGIVIIFLLFGKQIMNTFGSWLAVRQDQYGGSITVANTISERSNQWFRGIENSNWFIGSGFGSRGHKAAANGFANYVADGNWILILCESGIIGLLSFVLICANSLIKGLRNFRKLFLPLGVMVTFMFQSIGSNVLEQQLVAPLFWLAVGQILSYRPYQEYILS